MRYLIGSAPGFLAVPALAAVFVTFLRIAAATIDGSRGAKVVKIEHSSAEVAAA